MKQLRSILMVSIFALLAGGLATAQSNPFVGTWKLNVPASKFDPGPAPQGQTRAWEAGGKVTVTGVTAAGKSVTYNYTIAGDGKDYPTGGAIPNGSDHVSSKKAGDDTYVAQFTREGKVVENTTFKVSKDGKSLTILIKGVLPSGQAMNNETHWDKQ